MSVYDIYGNLKVAVNIPDNQDLLINGNFSTWQRGTSFTAATTPPNSDDNYLMDRWILLSDSNDIVDVSRQGPSGVPSGGHYFARFLVQTANKQFAIMQPIEALRAIPFRGKTVSLFLQARTEALITLDNIRAGIIEWTGTANSITSDVIATWAGSGTNPTLATNWSYANTPSNLPLIPITWQIYKIENVTLGSSFNNLAVLIWLDDTTTTINDLVDIATVGLYAGATAPEEYVPRDFRIDQELCGVYYRKIAANAANPYAFISDGPGIAASTTQVQYLPVKHPIPMRSVPSIGSNGSLIVSDTITFTAVTSIAVGSSTNNLGLTTLLANVASGLTQYRPYTLLCNNDTTAYVTFDSEL